MKNLVGKKVILKPKKGRDAFDVFLKDKIGIVESVETDFEDRVYVAVVLEDDEGKDLGFEKKIAHRFFFEPSELEIIAK